MLVSIEFPDDLVIAQVRVEIRNARPEALRRAASVHRVDMPIDGILAATEREVAVSEQVIAPASYLVGAANGILGGRREQAVYGARDAGTRSGIDEKS